jgi:nicotinamidase-related amidase
MRAAGGSRLHHLTFSTTVSVFDRSASACRLAMGVPSGRRWRPTHEESAAVKSALIVIDVQQSFMRRPYWQVDDVDAFVRNVQQLIDRAAEQRVPVLQVFHVEEGADNPFALHTGFVKTLPELRIEPTEVFHKSVHSAMFAANASGQSVEYWLRRHGIDRLIVTGIRTEQCCETTTRHASDLGFTVTYALDATLTFPMVAESGRTYSPAEIRERTALVLAGRFAEVLRTESIRV